MTYITWVVTLDKRAIDHVMFLSIINKVSGKIASSSAVWREPHPVSVSLVFLCDFTLVIDEMTPIPCHGKDVMLL